jgi:hypothetical protein
MRLHFRHHTHKKKLRNDYTDYVDDTARATSSKHYIEIVPFSAYSPLHPPEMTKTRPETETNPLVSYQQHEEDIGKPVLEVTRQATFSEAINTGRTLTPWIRRGAVATVLVALVGVLVVQSRRNLKPLGPYQLVECQEGQTFFDYYDFLDGPDSLGSAGYNVYVGKKRATQLGILNITSEKDGDYVYMKSAPTNQGPRESLRLEGKRRFDRGLFILDLTHMPTGCGVWPAFWLTDEPVWPNHGEIDVVEGINLQSVAKTALHTSDRCSMYAHVPPYAKSGVWDTATGIPNTWTGMPDFGTKVDADNCWVSAAHQWANQGCVVMHTENDTLGEPINNAGGAVYVLDWDPENRYIKSWVFHADGIPANLQQAMETAGSSKHDKVMPDPDQWNVVPYAYFAIGETTGCSADHFQNMRLVINLAFCGNVAGNRFQRDCPAEAAELSTGNKTLDDPIQMCNALIKSNPKELEDAYWKIRGVYVYERELVRS